MQLIGHKSLMRLFSGREIYIETCLLQIYLLVFVSHIYHFLHSQFEDWINYFFPYIHPFFWLLVADKRFWGLGQHDIRKQLFILWVHFRQIAYLFWVRLNYLKTPKLILTFFYWVLWEANKSRVHGNYVIFSVLVCLNNFILFLWEDSGLSINSWASLFLRNL